MSTISMGHEGINGLDRVTLCALPTPLVEAKRLAESLGRTGLFVKRDDLSGLALGGNKPRACEFVMGQAKASGHDVVIAVGPQHSNQLCAIAAAAKKCGMPAILLLLRGDDRVRGNLLLFRILGAEVRFTDVDLANIEEAYEQMEALADHLQNEGARPYMLRYGPLPLVGIAGYVILMREMLEQLGLRRSGRAPAGTHHIFVGSGSGLTQAGLILGDKVLGGGCRIHGVMLDEHVEQEEHERNVLKAVETAAALFGRDFSIGADDIRCIPDYAGNDAAAQTKASEAMRLAARSEGLLLDPVYTAKVMAAMIDQIRAGRIPPEDTVVFYHSGGIPAIFSHCRAEAF